jgi:hypothetical protein
MTDKELYKKAKKRVEAKRAVLAHFLICAAVSVFLIFLYFVTYDSPDYANGDHTFWPLIPIGGMALSVLIHAGVVFADRFNFDSSVEKEYEKLKSSNQNPDFSSRDSREN